MTEPIRDISVGARFPALARLGRARERRIIPFVQQLQTTDCGAACLAMVLAYHGQNARTDQIREAMASDRDGVNVLRILEAAQAFGMRGRGVRLDVEDLSHLRPASILHWDMAHFVVLEKIGRRGVWIIDPAAGRRRLSPEEVGRHFTGVALELEPTGAFARSPAGNRGTWRYLRAILQNTSLLPKIIVSSLLLQVLALAIPMFTGALIDQVIPNADRQFLLVLTLGALTLAGFGALTQMVRGYLMLQLRVELDLKMTMGLIEHLVRLPFSFFQTRRTGDLMLRLNSMSNIREILTSSTASLVLDGSLVLGYLVLLLVVQPVLGAIVLGLAATRVVVFFAFRRANARLMAQNLQAQAASASYQMQMIQGIETLKSAGAEANAVQRWSHLFADLLNNSIDREKLTMMSDVLLKALTMISSVLILSYGGFLVLQQKMSLGTMLAVNALVAGLLGPATSLVSAAMQLQLLGSYVERVEDVLNQELEQPAVPGQRRARRLKGALRLVGISFRYGPASSLVLRDLSLGIDPGQMIAIVGRSGSGKSTLARLMIGLYQPTEGAILVDDLPLAECDMTAIRKQVGFVPQFPQFFDASIRDNIALSDPAATLDDIERAARVACIHEEIRALPLGYETLLSHDGGSISGGQRQRIAIARALLQRPAVLILDEATSHLDGATENAVFEGLSALSCTRVVIAHRLSTIAQAESIVVLEEGRIIEQGTHPRLVENGGAYAGLVLAQSER